MNILKNHIFIFIIFILFTQFFISCEQKTTDQLLKEKGGLIFTLKFENKENIDTIIAQETVSIIQSRLDEYNIKQSEVNYNNRSNNFIVKLPKVKDSLRYAKILQATGGIKFQPTYTNTDAFKYLKKADLKLAELGIYFENENIITIKDSSLNEETPILIEKLNKQKHKNNLTDEQKSHPLLAVLITPPFSNSAICGISDINDTAIVNKYLSSDSIKDLFPQGLKFIWSTKNIYYNKNQNQIDLIAINDNDSLSLDESIFKNIRTSINIDGNYKLVIDMNDTGSKKWVKCTKNNIGKEIAIVYENTVYSHPKVNSEITGGKVEISGSFSKEEIKDFACILKLPRLMYPIKICETKYIKPSSF